MALADPVKIKDASGSEVEAPRTGVGDFRSIYTTPDGALTVSVSTSETNANRKRHLVRVDVSKLAENALEEDKKQTYSMSVYLVVDRPLNGWTLTDAKKLVEGLVGFLSASSYANTTKVLGGES